MQLKTGGEMRKKKKEFELVFFRKVSVGSFWLLPS